MCGRAHVVHAGFDLGTERVILRQECHADTVLAVWRQLDSHLCGDPLDEGSWHGEEEARTITCNPTKAWSWFHAASSKGADLATQPL